MQKQKNFYHSGFHQSQRFTVTACILNHHSIYTSSCCRLEAGVGQLPNLILQFQVLMTCNPINVNM